MADVFISYKRQDIDAAREIATSLNDAGISCWFDTALTPGEHWDETIRRELNDSNCVVVVWSEQSWDSRFVHAEALEGFERDVLVAGRIDDVRLGPPFNVVQTADLRTDEGFASLIKAVRSRLGTDPANQRHAWIWESEGLGGMWIKDSDEVLDRLRVHLIELACRRRTASYIEIIRSIDFPYHNGVLYNFLDSAVLHSEDGKRLFLNALAISSGIKMPGEGFFTKHFPDTPRADWTGVWHQAVSDVFKAFSQRPLRVGEWEVD